MLKFYHAPWSRASGVHWLIEELDVAYEPVHIDIRAEGGVPEDYRRIQPNKKVPAIDHTSAETLRDWVQRRRARGLKVELSGHPDQLRKLQPA